jgi:hypothetical protein
MTHVTQATGTKTLTGSVFALARWFDIPVEASGPYDDEKREEILGDVYDATVVGVSGNKVIARTPLGACIMEATENGQLVEFDHAHDGLWKRTRFWMNASSVRHLGDHLRTLPRRPFDELFVGAR